MIEQIVQLYEQTQIAPEIPAIFGHLWVLEVCYLLQLETESYLPLCDHDNMIKLQTESQKKHDSSSLQTRLWVIEHFILLTTNLLQEIAQTNPESLKNTDSHLHPVSYSIVLNF